MIKSIGKILALGIMALAICTVAKVHAAPQENSVTTAAKTETIVLAGGCFWGVEAVFEHTNGVTNVISGYAGGKAENAQYELVSRGNTGHAEAVQITYHPAKISLNELLDIFFTVAHNPTQLNYQGPDRGTQYRSAIFYSSDDQRNIATAKIATLNQNKLYSSPIVTTLEPLSDFYAAEAYHQNYAAANPFQPYILIHDAPKVSALEKKFPNLFKN